MYRVFEALDELVTIVEEARGVPMTSSCVVPRGDVLELLDDVRDALPGEVDDAQDVLDKRDELIDKARTEAGTTIGDARDEADRTLSDANAEAERMIADARARAEQVLADADAEAQRMVAAGQAEYHNLTERSRAESARIVDEAHIEADRQRVDCDAYVDGKLAEFSELLAATLRTVDSGRNHLRAPSKPGGRSTLYDFQP